MNQFGFRKNMSTSDAIYEFIDNLLTSLDNTTQVKGIFADLNKAFDLVKHDILEKNCEHFGI